MLGDPLIEQIRDFINGLSESDFDTVRKSTSVGEGGGAWGSFLTNHQRPKNESLEIFIETLHRVAGDWGKAWIPTSIKRESDYLIILGVFYAVNDRYMMDIPELEEFD